MRKTRDQTQNLTRGRLSADEAGKFARSDVASEDTARFPPGSLPSGPDAAAPFQWPAPPYYEFDDPGVHTAAVPCLLTFSDGAKAAGTLLDFSAEENLLRFRQDGAEAAVTIAFSGLLRLELNGQVALRRQSLPASVEQRVFGASSRQAFEVRLLNGEIHRGETVGYIEALCGLFLFLPDEQDHVTRCFIPAQAAMGFSIGKLLGQMLVEEKLASSAAVDTAVLRQKSLRSRRVGEYLTENQIVTQEQLAVAIKRHKGQPLKKLGETLVELGYLSEVELKDALVVEARNRTLPLGQILADMGVVEPEMIPAVMAKQLGIPFINLRTFAVAPEILKKIPANTAHRYQAVPLAESDKFLVVAIDNPMDMSKVNGLRFILGVRLFLVMASASDIRGALLRYYGAPGLAVASTARAADKQKDVLSESRPSEAESHIGELTALLAAESVELELDERHAEQNDTTLVKLVNKIILDAVEQKASDIHIEVNPESTGTRVRFRKDGVLVTYLELPSKFRRAVISRIKIMSQLDITERRRPQDGKIEFSRFGPARVELRVATIPTSNGLEDVVMRVLSAAAPVAIDRLGFDAAALASVKQLMTRRYGLFLVCGPTGSGKTTTLHSLLGDLNIDERKIWTAEDPIEIAQPGLRQVQVNAKLGWTFAAAMRSFMRADPDVIMVGEMRDAETAKIGIEASLTGHLVLSTLHTNSAAESVVRLLDLGMDPFNFADALLGVLSQRLVRRLCGECKVGYSAAGELEQMAQEYCSDIGGDPAALLLSWRTRHSDADGAIVLYRAEGCEQCNHIGYQGRMGVYELLVADAAVKRLVQARAPITEIRAAGMANGMRTLKQDGIDKVLQGATDMLQVRAV